MRQFAVTVAGVFVGLLLFFVALPIFLIVMALGSAKPVAAPARTVLTLDLRDGLTDQEAQSPFAGLRSHALSVMSIEQTLRRAETDNHIKALFVRLPEGGVAPAAADELRLAFKHFEAAGKPVIAHSQGLYPSGIVSSTYMLGLSASELWMQPGASLQVTGLASEDLFYKRFFDKYGIKPQFEQRYEYKTAINSYLYDNYTPAQREEQLSWMTSIYKTALFVAAGDRRKNPAALESALEAGPYTAEEALKKGLVDRVGQVKEAELAARAKAGDGAKVMDLTDYAAANPSLSGLSGRPAIAVVNAEGAIQTGASKGGSLLGTSQAIYSDDLAEALYQAAADKDVKAVVLRVSSPGGSDTASEQILAAVRAVKAAGKPVVVSMGTYAASGGYWISSQASYIVAEPTTLTGSIGVFGGKFALGDALAHFGVDVRQTAIGGDFAGTYAMGAPFTDAQRAGFARLIDKVYDGFIDRVSSGRRLSPERVRQIAKGRVWTGVQAKSLGLVDQIGGFYDAVDKAKAMAGLAGKPVRLKMLPARRSAFQALQQAFGAGADSAQTLATVSWLLHDPKAQMLLNQASDARLRSQGALVLAPSPVR